MKRKASKHLIGSRGRRGVGVDKKKQKRKDQGTQQHIMGFLTSKRNEYYPFRLHL